MQQLEYPLAEIIKNIKFTDGRKRTLNLARFREYRVDDKNTGSINICNLPEVNSELQRLGGALEFRGNSILDCSQSSVDVSPRGVEIT